MIIQAISKDAVKTADNVYDMDVRSPFKEGQLYTFEEMFGWATHIVINDFKNKGNYEFRILKVDEFTQSIMFEYENTVAQAG